MEDFISALLEFVKFQNAQQLQLQDGMKKLLIQTKKENQEKSEEKQQDYQQKQLDYLKEMEQK